MRQVRSFGHSTTKLPLSSEVKLSETTLSDEAIRNLWLQSGKTQREFSRLIGLPFGQLHSKISNAQQREVRNVAREIMKPSPYPVFDKPLEMFGDVLVIPDPEFPYHNADFLNRVLDLADAWGIKQCNIAGDALHFNSISKWEPAWTLPATGGLSELNRQEFLLRVRGLPAKQRAVFIDWLDNCTYRSDTNSVGDEVEIARRCLVRLGEQFDQIDYVLGNHDGRFLSALHSPLFANQLLQFIGIEEPKWRIAPYYYSVLHTDKGDWRIEHPRGASKSTPYSLASKYLCNVAQGHSHRLSMEWDKSGNWYAIHMGCCVDENRLPYASQRSNASDAHKLGAMIIRDGYPYLLHDGVDWKWMRKRT